MKPFSEKTIEAAKKMGLNMSAIKDILESEDLQKVVKLKDNSDYIIRDLIRYNTISYPISYTISYILYQFLYNLSYIIIYHNMLYHIIGSTMASGLMTKLSTLT